VFLHLYRRTPGLSSSEKEELRRSQRPSATQLFEYEDVSLSSVLQKVLHSVKPVLSDSPSTQRKQGPESQAAQVGEPNAPLLHHGHDSGNAIAEQGEARASPRRHYQIDRTQALHLARQSPSSLPATRTTTTIFIPNVSPSPLALSRKASTSTADSPLALAKDKLDRVIVRNLQNTPQLHFGEGVDDESLRESLARELHKRNRIRSKSSPAQVIQKRASRVNVQFHGDDSTEL
jgi:hypothetical protein